MRPETIEQAVKDLVAVYDGEVQVARDGTRTLVRLACVELYPECRPPLTDMLLMFDPAQPKPLPFVRPGQLLANGRAPRSTSTVIIAGESWLQFSYNIPWTEGDSILRFVAAARGRFALDD